MVTSSYLTFYDVIYDIILLNSFSMELI